MPLILLWIILPFVIAAWAEKKNRSFASWFWFAFLCSPFIAAICLLVSGDGGKRCPKCAESVKPEAVVCKHCGLDFIAYRKELSAGLATVTARNKQVDKDSMENIVG